MQCDDMVSAAVMRCPFLSAVRADRGEVFARAVAVNPFTTASTTAGPVLLEESMSSFAASLASFHGPHGVVPLARFQFAASAPAASTAAARPAGCPYRHASAPAPTPTTPLSLPSTSGVCGSSPPGAASCSAAAACAAAAAPCCPAAATTGRAVVPFASMSLGGFGFLVSLCAGLFPLLAHLKARLEPERYRAKPPDPG